MASACGDLIIAGDEECEDGNTTSGDGCGGTCRLEEGFKCPTVGAPCLTTVCGDGIVEGTEQCDDGNRDMGDGCSPLCGREPQCVDGVCTAICGDGVMLPGDTSEACDDGNSRSHDGCSSTCQLEEGFTCALIENDPPSTMSLPLVLRDFRGYDLPASDGLPRGHVDFENANGSETGIVQALLGVDGKPRYAKAGVSSSTTHGQVAFDQWYRDTPNVNLSVVKQLPLSRIDNTATYEYRSASFFPLDNDGWVAFGKEPRRTDGSGVPRNFSFTSETRTWFEYKGTEELTFLGDDDVWVFINRRLALDLGGVHGPMSGRINLASKAVELGLQVGRVYEVAVFQAERHTTGSNYRLTLDNFLARRSECVANCGNGVVDPGEACDDGVNDGSYNTCARGCVLGPRCGDSIVQTQYGEQCDDGNTRSNDGCSAFCRLELP
ncbi:lipoprotein [Melittangium boletus DSM 14713]|uniref:Lipoprotein n=1 Tax=Melittangium boletus DSM 14713 TaxID=1294270 RepID=A0A250IB89_9BACT|nr:lipoprotein [Melittangium boletus DSM 14713]